MTVSLYQTVSVKTSVKFVVDTVRNHERLFDETLSRTIMTSATTLLVVLMLYLFGGAMLEGFSLVMLIGVTIGTIIYLRGFCISTEDGYEA